MRKLHVLTTLGLVLGIAGLALSFAGYFVIGSLLAVVGYFAGFKEVPKHTTHFQFFTVFFNSLVIGLSCDLASDSGFLLMITTMLAAVATLTRIVFFKNFTYTGYSWFEPLVLCITLMIWSYAAINGTYHWSYLTISFLPFAFAAIMAVGFYKDRIQMFAFLKNGMYIEVGKEAPEFTLPDQDNTMVSLSSFRNNRDLLLIFVRGDWCPGCHMMLRTYQRERHKFQEKNIMVIAIGPDPVGVNLEMVKSLELDFKVLSDEKLEVARQYGIKIQDLEHMMHEFEDGSPLPASFLVDKNGIVRYVSRPDKVGEFLNPSMIFPILEKLPA